MQTIKRQNDFCCVESSASFRKLSFFAQVVKKLSTIQKIHNEVEFGWRLKRKV
jgi:hypothetical protein